MKKYALIAVAFLAIQSCSVDSEIENGSKSLVLNQKVEVKVGECVSNNSLKVCVDSVSADSRCPADAICIWEGNAAIELTITIDNELHQITLNTNGQFATDTLIENYKIKLTQLSPYPELQNQILQKEYVAELIINEE